MLETSTSPGSGVFRDACSGVDGDAGDLAVDELALARVEPRADVEAEVAHSLDDRLGAADGACRPVEGRQEAVAHGVHLLAARPRELRPDERVVLLEQLTPGPVADFGHVCRRADDVGEEDRGQNSLRLASRCLLFPRLAQERLDRLEELAHVGCR